MADVPFIIEVLDRNFRPHVAFVSRPESLTLTPRHLEVTTAELTVSNRDPAVGALYAPGARLAITYKGETYTGPIKAVTGSASKDSGTLTFSMQSDFTLLSQILAWPKPDAPLDAQTVEYDVRVGPVESVVKGFIAANAARLHRPVTIAPDWARGPVVKVSGRMQPLSELLLPVLEAAGLGLSITQVGAGFLVDCYEPIDYPRVLTEDGGTIASWELSRTAPTATRAVLGGGGEKTARLFRQVIDTALETEWGDVNEVFRDADDAASDYRFAADVYTQAQVDFKAAEKTLADAIQDVRIATLDAAAHPSDTAKAQALADANTAKTLAQGDRNTAQAKRDAAVLEERKQYVLLLAEVDKRGREDALAEGAPTAGLKVTLRENDTFTYGGPNGLHVGTRFRMEVGPDLVVEDLLRECVISWTTDDGLQVTPVVGELTSNKIKSLGKVLGGLAASLRKLISRR